MKYGCVLSPCTKFHTLSAYAKLIIVINLELKKKGALSYTVHLHTTEYFTFSQVTLPQII
jgi:hypothetical protein